MCGEAAGELDGPELVVGSAVSTYRHATHSNGMSSGPRCYRGDIQLLALLHQLDVAGEG